MLEGLIVHRMGPKDFAEAATAPPPAASGRGAGRAGRGARGRADLPAPPARRGSLTARIAQFYKSEGVVAAINRGSDTVMASVGSSLTATQQRTDGGTIFPAGSGSRSADAGTGVPTVTLAVEHYNRMVRLLARGIPVKVELNVQTEFHDETTPNGFNIVAEIPGTDPRLKDEVVMLGAHFDSVAAGTGATDNAAGSAAMMEAMRILKAIDAKPRRTVRIALWGGEEEGLLGSRAYVRQHFGADHVSFDAAGLPGFQFMVDRLEYNSRTQHSNMDVYDRVQRDDMIQQATVIAVFAYNAAMRDEPLPRKPLPTPDP